MASRDILMYYKMLRINLKKKKLFKIMVILCAKCPTKAQQCGCKHVR